MSQQEYQQKLRDMRAAAMRANVTAAPALDRRRARSLKQIFLTTLGVLLFLAVGVLAVGALMSLSHSPSCSNYSIRAGTCTQGNSSP